MLFCQISVNTSLSDDNSFSVLKIPCTERDQQYRGQDCEDLSQWQSWHVLIRHNIAIMVSQFLTLCMGMLRLVCLESRKRCVHLDFWNKSLFFNLSSPSPISNIARSYLLWRSTDSSRDFNLRSSCFLFLRSFTCNSNRLSLKYQNSYHLVCHYCWKIDGNDFSNIGSMQHVTMDARNSEVWDDIYISNYFFTPSVTKQDEVVFF